MPTIRRPQCYLLLALCVSGCGAHVPRIGEAWENDYSGDLEAKIIPVTASGQIEYEVKKNVYCELRDAVKAADAYSNKTNYRGRSSNGKILPDEWGAQVSLSFQVDENASLNPGVTLNTPLETAISQFAGASSVMTPQNRTVALGGTLSSTASRTDKFNSYYDIAYLRDPTALHKVCGDDRFDAFAADPSGIKPAKSSFLADDLGIQRWVLDALFVDEAIPSFNTKPAKKAGAKAAGAAGGGSDDKSGQDANSIEIKFVVVTSGTVTPTWKLVRVSANTAGTFFGAGRTRTHDLIVTIGPKNTQTDYANLALQIGQAVSGGNRSSAPQ